ncbi:MAG: flavodoxin domain-containing protein [Deltaproteobacteria bacterium]|nr:flavodoxin domain-containing protein [Deltaproteobacteria bacterium]
MAKALVVYATRSGQTKRIADLLAEGLRIGGMEVDVKDATAVKSAEELQGYDAYLFGSATYHGDMMASMKQLLFLAEKAGLEGKCGGSFGSFGWSGEAHQRIFDTMKHIFKMNMTGDCLRLKSADLEGAIPMCHQYGRDMAGKTS